MQDEERASEEAKIAADREEKQNKIIQSQSKKYEQYAKTKRDLNLQSMNSLQQIEVIEKNKQKIILMRENKEANFNAFRQRELANAEDDCKKIDDEPYALVDKDASGQPIDKARLKRETEKKKIKYIANTKIEEKKKQIEKNYKVSEYAILSEIKQNYKIIRKTASVNSIENPEVLRLRVENYDGNLFGWNASISFDFDTSRFYANMAFPVWPIFIGTETTLWQSAAINNKKKTIESVFTEWYNLNMNYGLVVGLHFAGFKSWLSPYIFTSGGVNYDFPTNNISGYVNGTIGLHFLGIFGINYSCEYNINKKRIQHLLGVSIGINIIKDKKINNYNY